MVICTQQLYGGKQREPNKPIRLHCFLVFLCCLLTHDNRMGAKLWLLVDALGVVRNIILYRGAEDPSEKHTGLMAWVMERLASILKHCNHIIYADNAYSSFSAVAALRRLHQHCVFIFKKSAAALGSAAYNKSPFAQLDAELQGP